MTTWYNWNFCCISVPCNNISLYLNIYLVSTTSTCICFIYVHTMPNHIYLLISPNFLAHFNINVVFILGPMKTIPEKLPLSDKNPHFMKGHYLTFFIQQHKVNLDSRSYITFVCLSHISTCDLVSHFDYILFGINLLKCKFRQ